MTEIENFVNGDVHPAGLDLEVDLDFEIEQEKARIDVLRSEIERLREKLDNEKNSTTPPSSDRGEMIVTEQKQSYILTPDLFSIPPISPIFMDEQAFSKDLVEDGLVLYSRNFQIMLKGGTLEKVIERLTLDSSDDGLVDTFLLTYRKYLTAEELMEKIWEHYDAKMDDPDRAQVIHAKKIIRLRIVNFTKRWLLNHFHDYLNNSKLCDLLRTKCQETSSEKESLTRTLLVTLDDQLSKHGEQVHHTIINTEKAPDTFIPKSSSFDDFDPIEIARQLCLFEQNVFCAIHPRECLDQCWSKDQREKNCPHIVALISFFNSISGFVAHTILQFKVVKERVNVVRKFLKVVVALFEENNFNACQEIMSGLADASIYRLRKTWMKVEEKDKKLWQQYQDVVKKLSPAQNWKSYRVNLELANPPCLPYLGVYLTDLTFIEDGNKNYLTVKSGKTDLINLEKMRMQALVIQKILLYQQKRYNFTKVDVIYDFFANYGKTGAMPSLSKDDVKKLHPLSFIIETREEVELAKQKEAKLAEKLAKAQKNALKAPKARTNSIAKVDKKVQKK